MNALTSIFAATSLASILISQAAFGQTNHWNLDGDLQDSIGSAHGIMVGTESYNSNGLLAQSLSLDGSSYVNLGSNILSTTAYTKAAWVKRNGGGYNNILSGDTTANRHAFYAPNTLGYHLAAGHNGNWATVQDNVAIPNDTWTFVAVTYDSAEAGGTLRLYRNGTLAGGTPVATGIAPPNGGAALIGGFAGTSLWTGEIDDVYLFSRALSAEEIHQIYQDTANARCGGFARVPELADYDVVYELPIPTSSNLGTTGLPGYWIDDKAWYAGETSFDRIAYYLELTPVSSTNTQWICVSMDAFTRDAGKIGVPANATGAFFQRPLANMNVYSSEPTIATGTGIQTGNMEFWGSTYTASNSAGVPNASGSLYDVGDQPTAGGTYGSMQIHNHSVNGTSATQTLFAYNRWGGGGNSDLGIGSAPSGQPDWTFAQNATGYSMRSLYVLVRKKTIPLVQLAEMPKDFQLYPRDLDTGLVQVTVNGRVKTPNCDGIELVVTRDGAAYTNLVKSLIYGVDGADFLFEVPIVAELAGYDFSLQITSNATSFVTATATNVVAGDVLLINGQSNAEARSFSGSANGNRSPWIRSYGTRSNVQAEVEADTQWHLAEGDAVHAPGAVGQWGLRMGRNLVDTLGIPVAIINNAEGGKPISYFARNDANPGLPSNNYGQLLYRATQAGLRDAARAIFYYQGESDNGDANTHETGWLDLYQDWMVDYPSIEKVYVCQLHVGCGTSVWTADLRDRQRRLADRFDNVEVMSTTGLPNHDGCHYAYAGYQRLGDDLTRLILRDLYAIAQPSQATPPNPEYAYLPDNTGTNLVLLTRNPEDVLTVPPASLTEFRVEGREDIAVTSITASGNSLWLTWSGDIRNGGTGLSFSGHSGGQPSIRNALDIGLLSFHNLPIHSALLVPNTPTGLQILSAGNNRVELGWDPTEYAAYYLLRRDGVLLQKTYETFALDFISGSHEYQIAAVNPAGTSSWSAVVFSPDNPDYPVFHRVREALDYEVLYALDIPINMAVGSALDVPYFVDRSAEFGTNGIQRVAYVLELQERPGMPIRWAYASMNTFSTNAVYLGVPVLKKGKTFFQSVEDMNVYTSDGTGVTTGRHLTSGRIEFTGYNYTAANSQNVPGASATVYDHGDAIHTGGTYACMQIHNTAVPETILAYNAWGSSHVDNIGIGNAPTGNPDWTFHYNSSNWQFRRLFVLVQTDVNGNGLPDAWERRSFGSLNAPNGGPNEDYDQDGVSNLDEHRAGTNPANVNDFLYLSAPVYSGNTCTVEFPTEKGRTYHLSYKHELSDLDWAFLAEIEGTGEPVQINDPDGETLRRRYYRVSATP